MLERFIYTNSSNETLEFGKDCLFVNKNDLRDFTWDVDKKNNKISSFKKGIVKKTIPLIIKCNSADAGIYLRNRLFEIFEKDVLTKRYGKIHIGDYYLKCFVTGIKNTKYLVSKEYMTISVTIQTDVPLWIKETTTFHSITSERTGTHLDYSYDFPHDYANGYMIQQADNTGLIPTNFIMNIYGYVQYPTLYIGEHEYKVNIVVDAGEHLTIDSINKTIVLTKADGEQVNCFNNRNKDSYIFEKIPTGSNAITSPNQEIQFSITLLEERSEPRWI